jgi:undecaprenyl-diphosphatase
VREQTSLPARERTLPVVVVACCLPGVVPALARPDFKAVSHFDTAVDNFFEAHLRGRPALDRVMYAASAVGDHSAIWLALAALQGWRSGSGWRPLLRAGALLGVESALVNGLVKLAFRRERPESTDERPLPLRIPRTSSFPSGHSSAAFFAATLLGNGRTRLIYYVLASIVASSRVYVKIHHPSDVVAGAALGVILGQVAKHVVPLLPPRD